MIPSVIPEINYPLTDYLRKSGSSLLDEGLVVATFWPNLKLGVEGSPVDRLFDELYPEPSCRGKRCRRQALQCALLHLVNAATLQDEEKLCGVLHAATNTAPKNKADRYSSSTISNQILAKVLKDLVSHGYALRAGGRKGKGYIAGLSTVWFPSEKLEDWIRRSVNGLSVATLSESSEVLTLNTEDAKGKRFVDYPESDETRRLRRNIELTNEIRCKHVWRYIPATNVKSIGQKTTKERLFPDGRYQERQSERLFTLTQPLVIPDAYLVCHRLFRDDFKTYGRFYCKAQNLTKAERMLITVDGEATVEVDYKSMQLRMVYHMEGLEAPYDCYASSLPRGLVKRIALTALNAESRRQALRSVCKHLNAASKEADACFAQVEQEHSQIAHRFYQSLSGPMQFLDSVIAEEVMLTAAQEGIPVLPVHDSFRVAVRHASRIVELADKSYRNVMGFDPVVSMDGLGSLRCVREGVFAADDEIDLQDIPKVLPQSRCHSGASTANRT